MRKSTLRVLCLVATGLVLGCTDSANRDPATAYKDAPGPYNVAVEKSVALPFPALNKDMHLRITFPESAVAEAYPVIVFSHGGRCSRDRYTDFADHWASHGYIVIQPAHLDSRSVPPPPNLRGMEMMNQSVITRRLDMPFILDSLADIEALVPALAGRIDGERVAASGHSLGGATAMAVTGLEIEDPRDGSRFGVLDERFDVLLLITNPGNSPLMPEDPWRAVPVPTFIATGTNDFSGLVKHIKKSKSVFRFPDDIKFAATPNHYLFIEDMNHYLGGLLCKDLEGEVPDQDAGRIIGGASVAFLDAYLKDDALAIQFLQVNQIPGPDSGRATLSLR